jgi:hypothetical protein
VVSNGPPFGAEVAAYLADCLAFPWLDPAHHPTEKGAVNMIYHRDQDEKDQIKAAFWSAAPATATPGPQDRAVLTPLAIAGEDPDDTPA